MKKSVEIYYILEKLFAIEYKSDLENCLTSVTLSSFESSIAYIKNTVSLNV